MILTKSYLNKIFGHTLIKLADKLINTTNKKENQIIVKNINENKEKLYEMEPFHDWVIQPNSEPSNLIDAYQLVLNFNKTIQLDVTWKRKNWIKWTKLLIGKWTS